jgi:hypothetical protein
LSPDKVTSTKGIEERTTGDVEGVEGEGTGIRIAPSCFLFKVKRWETLQMLKNLITNKIHDAKV